MLKDLLICIGRENYKHSFGVKDAFILTSVPMKQFFYKFDLKPKYP